VGASFYVAEPEIWREHAWAIALVIFLEAARYPLDWYKFGRGASYHAWSARIFGITLIPATFLIMGFGYAGPFLWGALGMGVISELEGMTISLILPRWTHDVPHLGAALAIRRQG
jgi:CDP-diacylglycerol--glycerol-3-phosphate 3-phosphatidyltransferase